MAIEEKEIKVVGMHCPSCVNAVQLSLTDVDGIDDAKADLDSGITKVTLDTDKVSDADIKEAVEEAGFNVEWILLTFFKNIKSSKDRWFKCKYAITYFNYYIGN